MIALDRTTHCGTDIQALLDMVDRGCRRMMKAGGGPLPEDQPPESQRGLSKHDKAMICRRWHHGFSIKNIANELGISYGSTYKYVKKLRQEEKAHAPASATKSVILA